MLLRSDTMLEDKFPIDFESIKPNIPDCWAPEPVTVKQETSTK